MIFNLIATAVGGFVNSCVNRIISVLGEEQKESNLPAKIQEVRQDQRVRQAEIDYYHSRESREQELLTIQSNLANISGLRFKADMQIKTAKAEREEYTLQLKAQELKLKSQELEDRRKLSAIYLDIHREKNAKDIELKQKEIQAIFDQQKWPGVLSRDELERIFVDEQKKPRLLMLVPPPDISEDFPISFRDGLKKEVRNQLKSFLEKYYPLDKSFCPVEFYGKYFERSVFDAEVKQLETILAAVPTAVIYSDITDHEVYFNVRFWGLKDTVSLSFEPWNWEECKKQLIEEGNDEKQSFRVIRQTIVNLHKLYATFLADWYYLNIDPNYEPQILNMETEIPSEWKASILEKLSLTQSQYQKAYHTELMLLADSETKKTQLWQCINTLNHSNYVYSLAIHPDGKTFASGDKDAAIKIWNLNNGELLSTFSGHSSTVFSLKFNTDGMVLASGSHDHSAKLWYARTGVTLHGHSNYIDSIAFSPDSQILATGSRDSTIKLWDLSNTETICTLTGHEGEVHALTFIDNQTLISASQDKTIKVWNLAIEAATLTLTGHSDQVWDLAVSPDRKTCASASQDGTVKVWDLYSGNLIYTFLHTGSVFTVTFSPNGQILASAGNDKLIKLWHLGTKELINTLSGHSSSIYAIDFTPDGQKILSGSQDKTIKIWRVNS